MHAPHHGRGLGISLAAMLAACTPATEPRAVTSTAPRTELHSAPEAPEAPPTALDRAFDASLARLRTAFAPDGLVERRGAFAIGAPNDPTLWRRYVDGTLLSAAERLHAQLFTRRPSGPIEVYLFRGGDAFREGARALTGSTPTTPYGFYQSAEKRLILDVDTGGGTLVHELVHALADEDCPELPAWINEGLGSLFEACRFEERRVVGLVNWRLAGLRRAWEAGDWEPSLAELPTLDDATFYGVLSGRHYALARYAMLFLQERGMLEKFYATYRAQEPEDSTGKLALEMALGGEVADFEGAFREFLRELRDPR